MKLFSVVLELKNQYQSGPSMGKTFTSKSEIHFVALDEKDAKELIEENFGHRMRQNQQYELKREGEAASLARGFAITPLH